MKFNIFIETSSWAFAAQLMTFSGSDEDSNTQSLLLTKESKINTQGRNNVHVFTYQQQAIAIFIHKIGDFLSRQPIDAINIFAGISTTQHTVLPLIKRLQRHLPTITLHLFEERASVLAYKEFAENSPQAVHSALLRYADEIKNELVRQSSTPPSWGICMHYAWAKVVKTHFYVRHATLPAGLLTTRLHSLDEDKRVAWLSLFGLTPSLYENLKNFLANNAVLLTTTPYSSLTTELHYAAVEQTLEGIKNEFCGQANLLTHSAENSFIARLHMRGWNVITLPQKIIADVLLWCGVTPSLLISDIAEEALFKPANAKALILTSAPEEDTHVLTNAAQEQNLITTLSPTREVEHYRQQQPKTKRIYICTASMGDTIFALGAINHVRKENPNEETILISRGIYRELIEASSAVDAFWEFDKLTPEMLFDLELVKREGKLHVLATWEQILAPAHMTDAFISGTGKSIAINTHKQAPVTITSWQEEKVETFFSKHNLTNNKIVLIHANVGSKNRTWFKDSWLELAKNFIHDGWQVIFIGSDKNNYGNKSTMEIMLPGAVDGRNCFSLLETVALMQRCDLLVATDSGPVALAGLCNIAICALYTIIPAKNRLPWRHGELGWNASGIDVGCHYGQCGHLIGSESFFKNTLHKKYKSPTGTDFDVWCPNKQTYTCLRKYSARSFWNEITAFLASERYRPTNV
ncbi:hypothetical protein MUA03_01605 [Enterobacteriaceae bacterium H16N7]|nr:hypothetical protein [Dryocola clanedunensis]